MEKVTMGQLLDDHTMYAAAITAGHCRWEPLGGWVDGEICIDGLRYCANLDEYGVPILTSTIRAALIAARAGKVE